MTFLIVFIAFILLMICKHRKNKLHWILDCEYGNPSFYEPVKAKVIRLEKKTKHGKVLYKPIVGFRGLTCKNSIWYEKYEESDEVYIRFSANDDFNFKVVYNKYLGGEYRGYTDGAQFMLDLLGVVESVLEVIILFTIGRSIINLIRG